MARLEGKIVVASIAVFFSACTVGPDYLKPTAVVPLEFKETKGWKVAQPQDEAIKGKWWEIFNDPQLNALEERVAVSNQNIIEAEARFRQARALVLQARAGYFPRVTANVSHDRSRISPGSGRGAVTGSGVVSEYSLSGDLTWELDLWGRVRRAVEANRAGAEASAADLQAALLSAQAELALSYFQLRSLDAQKQLLEATVLSYQQSLEITKNRYAAGVVSMADVLQAEAQLKSTQAQSIDIGIQRARLEHAIALLVGEPPAQFSLPPAPLNATLPTIPVGLPSELLERRPDIAAAERRVALANAQIGVAQAAYYPTVVLSASGGFIGRSLSDWLTWPNRFWSVGPAIAETIFEGGLRRAQTEEARAIYDASVALYRQTVLDAFQEVEDNLAALRLLEEEALAQAAAVEASRQSVGITGNQYSAGTVPYLNIIVTQTTALANERAAVEILGRRMSASVLLIKALGGGWELPPPEGTGSPPTRASGVSQ